MIAKLNRARVGQRLKRILAPAINRWKYGRWWGWRLSEDERLIDLKQRLKQHPPVFVYQMGKVGSTSVAESLKQTYPGAVIHSHTFGRHDSSASVRLLFDHYTRCRPTIKIITLIREPVTRNISAFFQNFKRDTGVSIEHCTWPTIKIRQRFLDNYPHEIPLIWLDENLHRHFGIDLYQAPFPNCGYLQLQQGPVQLLTMRHDLHNDQKQTLIRSFVGDDQFQLQTCNVTAEKKHARMYAEFLRVKLPLQHLYYLASSKYMHHFFCEDIRRILQTWSDQPLPNGKSKS